VKLLFFDTETTGLPRNYKAPVSDLNNWPRLVQIAWLVTDIEGNELGGKNYIVKPNGFSIPKEASRVHGITTEIALKKGEEIAPVLESFLDDLEEASVAIAHNITFDEKIAGSELLRSGYPNLLDSKRRFCTMRSSTSFCAIPGYYGNKWPKLQELHVKLFGEDFDGAHDALADVKACARCFFKLREIGIC